MDETSSSPLGEYIRRQRELQKLSMRQLAGLVGISNPYLSQIEHGLREPSEQVLDAIAKGLDVSTETLYAQAGIDLRRSPPAVVNAIRDDKSLSGRQKQTLIEIYEAFTGRSGTRRRRASSARARGEAAEASASEAPRDS
jgi:transcriptional regulator with XRE-family HTH domain